MIHPTDSEESESKTANTAAETGTCRPVNSTPAVVLMAGRVPVACSFRLTWSRRRGLREDSLLLHQPYSERAKPNERSKYPSRRSQVITHGG